MCVSGWGVGGGGRFIYEEIFYSSVFSYSLFVIIGPTYPPSLSYKYLWDYRGNSSKLTKKVRL